MKILLRRASSLARACGREAQTIIKDYEAESEIRFSAHSFSNPTAVTNRLTEASEKVMRQIEDVLELLRAQSKIRAIISSFNAETISPLLAEKAVFLAPAEKALATFLASEPGYPGGDSANDADEITARLYGIQQRLKTATSGTISDTVRVPKLSAANIVALREKQAELQRRQLDLSEEVAQANLGVTIVLPDDVVKVLRKHKIIK